MSDVLFMERALRLAARGRGMTSPNPLVGAVIVKKGDVIAKDFHRKAGSPHAEALALLKAGRKARSATLYVTLEPCCHTDKRTPPCTRAIVDAGIKRVVIAMKDPNPKVSGKGINELERSGIEVTTGLLQEKARKLNEFYIKHITTGKPFVILKVAMTLDGKIADPLGRSQWITGEKARHNVHRLRSSVDAVITAIGTVKADDPELTARIPGGRNPMRIVIDPRLRISRNARLLQTPPGTILVASKKSIDKNASFIKFLASRDITVFAFPEVLDMNWLMKKLGAIGITSLLIEGGSSLNAHALEDRVVDKVMFFIAPTILGGKESYPAVGGRTGKRLADAYRLRSMETRRVGHDILIEGYL